MVRRKTSIHSYKGNTIKGLGSSTDKFRHASRAQYHQLGVWHKLQKAIKFLLILKNVFNHKTTQLFGSLRLVDNLDLGKGRVAGTFPKERFTQLASLITNFLLAVSPASLCLVSQPGCGCGGHLSSVVPVERWRGSALWGVIWIIESFQLETLSRVEFKFRHQTRIKIFQVSCRVKTLENLSRVEYVQV